MKDSLYRMCEIAGLVVENQNSSPEAENLFQSMKPSRHNFVKRYGKDAEKVMYGRAKNLTEDHVFPSETEELIAQKKAEYSGEILPGKPFIIYDQNNNVIYNEDSDGQWFKCEYDQNQNKIYFEDSNNYWYKCEFDQNNNEIYHKNSNGYIEDNRPNQNQNINESFTRLQELANLVI